MGIPRHLVELVAGLYNNQEAAVRWNGQLTAWFPIEQGTRQGCSVLWFFFIYYSNPGHSRFGAVILEIGWLCLRHEVVAVQKFLQSPLYSRLCDPFINFSSSIFLECLNFASRSITESPIPKGNPRKGRGLGNVIVFWDEATLFKFRKCITIASATLWVKNSPETGGVSVTWPLFKFQLL